ncbi:MAG TPA: SGNH/GDSL hydrolase family protein [Candidatus Polarisedimenticolia bacterium]|nr:SGNH/GDSL hydrolase family protein [Candidatus Polarisedimenticolia bacterium]
MASETSAIRRTSSIHRWSAWIAPWIIVVGLLFVVEGAVRLLMPRADAVKYFTHGGRSTFDGDGAHTFVGDPDLGWRLQRGLRMSRWNNIPVTTTSDGFRADHEFPRPKRGPRVLCLGDSATFGHGIVSPAQVYPGVLERLLRERLANPALDVVPMGVPAYTSFQGRLWLEREIDRLDPDLITICFGFNDTTPGASDRTALSTFWPRRAARHLVYSSQALTHLLLGAQPLLAPAGTPDLDHPRVMADEYLENVRAMVEMARARGARALVIGQIYRNVQLSRSPQQNRRIAEYRRGLAQACDAWGVPFLEVSLLTEAREADNGGFFVDGEHPSPLGHQLLAERVVGLIVERGLLPMPPTATGP